jgi:hypothetical protein
VNVTSVTGVEMTTGPSPPPHIQHAARALSDWMAQHGYRDWILLGCADVAAVIRLERDCEACRLRLQALSRPGERGGSPHWQD